MVQMVAGAVQAEEGTRQDINRHWDGAGAKQIRRDCCETRELYRATLCTATGCLCGAKKQKNSSVLGLVPLNSKQQPRNHCVELLDKLSLVFEAGAREILVGQS
jgi:hypothetical protein